ncbi:hypothetical protein [Piscirickettsia salmonis]
MTILTTSSGAPIADDQNSLTAGERGPVLVSVATSVGILHIQ